MFARMSLKRKQTYKQILSKFPAYLWEDHIEDIVINFFVKEASLRDAAWFAKLTTDKHCSILENRTCLLWDVHSINRERNFNDYLEKCELPPGNVSGDVPFLLIHHLSKCPRDYWQK